MRNLRHKFLLGLVACLISVLPCTSLFAGSVTLSWVAPSKNADGTPNSDLSGYKIYYGTYSNSLAKSIDVKKTTTYQIANLSGDLTYYFAVTAYDFSGNESDISNMVSIEVLNEPPSEPILVSPKNKGKARGKNKDFTWKKSSDPDGDTITYDLNICQDPEMTTGCTTQTNVASVTHQGIHYAGMSSFSTGLIFSGAVLTLPFNRRGRKRVPLSFVIIAMAGMLFFISCGGGGSGGHDRGVTSSDVSDSADEIIRTSTELSGSTLYYWQVVAKDGQGGETYSPVWSFETD